MEALLQGRPCRADPATHKITLSPPSPPGVDCSITCSVAPSCPRLEGRTRLLGEGLLLGQKGGGAEVERSTATWVGIADKVTTFLINPRAHAVTAVLWLGAFDLIHSVMVNQMSQGGSWALLYHCQRPTLVLVDEPACLGWGYCAGSAGLHLQLSTTHRVKNAGATECACWPYFADVDIDLQPEADSAGNSKAAHSMVMPPIPLPHAVEWSPRAHD